VPRPVPIDPAKLIEAAAEFAEHQTGAGRPRAIWLRHAVSSAYYALFHAISRQTADHLLPEAANEDRLRLTRSFGHTPVKEVCEWISGRRGKPPRHAKPLVQSLEHAAVADVASMFCDLQEARHRADYDHLASFTKDDVVEHVRDAKAAIGDLAAAPADQRQAFFALVSLRARLS
jgi:hypothetical protein